MRQLLLILKYVVAPIFLTIIGRAGLEVIHMSGWYPELWIARYIYNPPSPAEIESAIWLISGFLAISLYAAECRFRLFERFVRPRTTAAPVSAESDPTPGITIAERKPFTDFRDWAVEAGWDADIFSIVVGENDFLTFKDRLEQAAADGLIRFWGRKYPYDIPEDLKGSEILVPIDPGHFRDFILDVQQLAESRNYDIFTHKYGHSHDQLAGQCFRDLHVDATQARDWLKRDGKAPPSASFNIQFIASPGQIGSYDCVCAIIVKNIESNELTNCLVQMEQISCTYPDQMPMPLVLRTDGQIRGSRTGRFTLSPNQPKSVPVLLKSRTRNNEWFFVDENGKSYFIPPQHFKAVLGIYGGKFSGKALVDIRVGDDWQAYPSLKIVSNDFVFSEAKG